MRLRSFRKSWQNLLAMTFAPHLYWQWSRRIGRVPALSSIYGQSAPAFRHRKKYLCRHWGIGKRLSVLIAHYEQMECLPAHWSEPLLAHRSVPLCEVPLKGGGALRLLLEPSDFGKEGEVGLYLRDDTGERLYSLSFCLGPAGRMLIGGLQGPRPGVEEGRVKRLGKEMFGLRPKNLLVTALYALGECIGCRGILGISDLAHTHAHKLKSSYDAFWLEIQGQRHDRHWYRLPDREPVRDIAAVKSQHRSEFRRREGLREAMVRDIRTAWARSSSAEELV